MEYRRTTCGEYAEGSGGLLEGFLMVTSQGGVTVAMTLAFRRTGREGDLSGQESEEHEDTAWCLDLFAFAKATLKAVGWWKCVVLRTALSHF